MPRIELSAIIALGGVVAGGLIWVGQMSQSVSDLKEGQTSTAIVKLENEIEKIRIDVEDIAVDRFSKFPVGSIIPFVGEKTELESFVRWKLCDGSTLKGEQYKDSPFYNRHLPKLDGVFLRATLSNNKLEFGGSETHTHSQAHTHSLPHKHSGQTGAGLNENGPPRDHHKDGGIHRHDFTTSSQDNATTTSPSSGATGDGTAIPPHVNVFYIIKVM